MTEREERELFDAMREILIDGLSDESDDSEWAQFLERLRAEADPELQAIVERIDNSLWDEPDVLRIDLASDATWTQTDIKV